MNVQAQGNGEFLGKKTTLDSEKDVAVYRCAICRMLEQNEHMPTPWAINNVVAPHGVPPKIRLSNLLGTCDTNLPM